MTNDTVTDTRRLRQKVSQLQAHNCDLRDERTALFQQRAFLEYQLKVERDKVSRVEQELASSKSETFSLRLALSESGSASQQYSLPERGRKYDDGDGVGQSDDNGSHDLSDHICYHIRNTGRDVSCDRKHYRSSDFDHPSQTEGHNTDTDAESIDEDVGSVEERQLRKLDAEYSRVSARLSDLKERIKAQEDICGIGRAGDSDPQ
ncbi:hypothetical protein EUX98_g3813 [Antrodiella citrinella]|uniref:Uncharacterized protein n=1 Tax=Antrodiella citrinella TaxID=2447956 RepID=A0A4S4MVJ0_9APHY|nr:hypothetical protein EUX98_g3813 [Antrodiella citrinella]